MTSLLDEIKAIIADHGPLTVEQYMQMALAHPEFGYYMNRDPFGATGDFTTAPEISQMFGELIGLWAAEVWSRMGSPRSVRLIELGPGRGTLMSDALRAARIAPAFRDVARRLAHGDEPDPRGDPARSPARLRRAGVLGPATEGRSGRARDRHRQRISRRAARCASSCASARNGESARCISTPKANLPSASPRQPEPYIAATAQNGEILEVNPAGHRFMFELGARLVKQGGAALLIDYGHTATGFGDTLQALRAHRYIDPLAAPGDCDLTAHVDFAAMARSARATGAGSLRPRSTRATFLRAIGIDLRTKALAERAGPERAEELQLARARLVGKAKGEMGALFKAMAITDRRLPAPPGFQPAAAKSA